MKLSKRELNDYRCKCIFEMIIGWLLSYAIFGLRIATLTVTFAFILCCVSIAKIQ